MKSNLIAATLVISIVLVGGSLYFFSAEKDEPAAEIQNISEVNEPELIDNNDNADELNSENESDITRFTPETVAQHNSEEDCWTIIDGSVYDITSYVPRHPGGDEILRACGKDGSSLFNNRETVDGEKVGSGSPHSSNAKNQLARLKIGELTNY